MQDRHENNNPALSPRQVDDVQTLIRQNKQGYPNVVAVLCGISCLVSVFAMLFAMVYRAPTNLTDNEVRFIRNMEGRVTNLEMALNNMANAMSQPNAVVTDDQNRFEEPVIATETNATQGGEEGSLATMAPIRLSFADGTIGGRYPVSIDPYSVRPTRVAVMAGQNMALTISEEIGVVVWSNGQQLSPNESGTYDLPNGGDVILDLQNNNETAFQGHLEIKVQ